MNKNKINQPDETLSLSEYERIALAGRVNLSDGHARHPLTAKQREIVRGTLDLLDVSLSRKQQDIETDFLNAFFECAGQNMSDELKGTFLTYSSSCAIKMAAQYCRIKALTVYLIEPCFDNIFHILQTEGVIVIPITEEQLCDISFVSQRLDQNTALWIVQPNNPTGFCLNERIFKELIKKVAEYKATILIDFCFRFFAEELGHWNQYEILSESKATFLCFEDTGKTWSLADTKVGITVCSADSATLIYRLHDELLLNVSPWHLLLLTEFIKDTLRNGLTASVRADIESNRRLVHALVEKGIVLHPSRWCRNVPMELLELPQNEPSTFFWNELRKRGVDILPAHNYFWSKTKKGRKLFRIPLSRPLSEIAFAMPIIEQTLLNKK